MSAVLRARFFGFVFVVVVQSLPASAHGPIPEQVAALSRRIESQPRDAGLHLRRGELHRVNGAWGAALADYLRAAELDPELAEVQLCLGRMLLEAGWPGAAKVALDRFLREHPDHIDGLINRARALAALGEGVPAAAEYTRALALTREPKRPRPECYLERARALVGEGDEHIDAALRGLDEGIERLGAIVTLELYAIELELTAGRYDAALGRLERVLEQSPRKERWLTRRAEILERAGRRNEARVAYAEALTAIESGSPHRRRARATRELESRLRAVLEATVSR